MKKLTVIISALLILTLFSCKDNSVEPNDTVDVEISGTSYVNKNLGISLKAPSDWQLEKDVTIGQYEAILIGNKDGSLGSRPAFNIVQQSLSTEMSAQTLLDLGEQNLPTMFPSMVFDSKRTVNINGFECAELVYHHTYEGQNLKQKQLMFVCRSKYLLVITFDSDLSKYESNKSEFDAIQNSITKL